MVIAARPFSHASNLCYFLSIALIYASGQSRGTISIATQSALNLRIPTALRFDRVDPHRTLATNYQSKTRFE